MIDPDALRHPLDAAEMVAVPVRRRQVIEVVGSADGVLARSATSRKSYRCPGTHMDREQQTAEYKRLSQAVDAERQAQEAQARQAGVRAHVPVPGRTPASRGLYEHAEHDWWGYTDGKALYEAWEKLPPPGELVARGELRRPVSPVLGEGRDQTVRFDETAAEDDLAAAKPLESSGALPPNVVINRRSCALFSISECKS